MNIHYFQHVPFEGLGSIEHWAKKPGRKITATRFYEDHKLPFIEICDMLIVMGGPMSSNDSDQLDWMTEEKKFIERAIVRGKKVIGICLGAQLIADVLGSRVYKNREKEIGWFPLQLTPEGKKSPIFSNIEEEQKVFHWHGETFDLPNGSERLAFTEGCDQQAFIYDNHVLGLQFHLEITEETISALVESCGEELKEKGTYIQTLEEIRNEDYIYKCNKSMDKILGAFQTKAIIL